MTRTILKSAVAAAVVAAPLAVFTANHREAPITALDRAADITDWYSFVSYDDPTKLTMILSVDPLLEPANGPNYFPFDPEILYEMKVDNNHDAVEDVTLQFRFQTEQRNPGVFTGFVGGLLGIPQITALDGAGSEGLGIRQTYTVTAIRGSQQFRPERRPHAVRRARPTSGRAPCPTTRPLYDQGIYNLGNGIRVFAGTTDDPFYIDLGAAFDSLNFRPEAGGGVLSVRPPTTTTRSTSLPTTSPGYNVNTIAIEIPISVPDPRLLAPHQRRAGRRPRHLRHDVASADHRAPPAARRQRQPRPGAVPPGAAHGQPAHQRAHHRHRLEGPLQHGRPDQRRASSCRSSPRRCSPTSSSRSACRCRPAPVSTWRRWSSTPARRFPPARRAGPVADLLRINTGIAPTPAAQQQRLGLLTLLDGNTANDDAAGFPNGRRPDDDVTDIAARAVAGILVNPATFGTRIGDGVNVNDKPKRATFPFVPAAHDGRNSRHVDPNEPGCAGVCPPGL